MKNSSFQGGTTWLLKHRLDSGFKLKKNQVKNIYRLLPTLDYWQVKLHLLQSMAYMPINNSEKSLVETFLRQCLTENNKFVRAWAYNGFYELSKKYPEYKEETKRFLDMAMKDEAASIKARIRNILKTGF